MLKEKVEAALNAQLAKEAMASQVYLAMASWAEANGYNGTAKFLFVHSDEERQHMLKLFHYINDRGGHAAVPALAAPKSDYSSIKTLFKDLLSHEIKVSESINELVGICLEEKDFTTNNFLQWYVNEQIEEESLARTILDKLELLGDDPARMYLFDRDIQTMAQAGA